MFQMLQNKVIGKKLHLFLVTIIPIKSINFYRNYFQTVESIVGLKSKKLHLKIWFFIAMFIYFEILQIIFYCTSLSDNIKAILGDSMHFLFRQKSFYIFYLGQDIIIIYIYVALYLNADLGFIQKMHSVLFGNGSQNSQNISLRLFDSKQSDDKKLQNFALILVNLLQIFQLLIGNSVTVINQIILLDF